MKLPRTREEYTIFALEYSPKMKIDLDRLDQFEKWVVDTVLRFPDLVYVKKHKLNSEFTVYIAGVLVYTFIESRVTQYSRSARLVYNLYLERKHHGQVT